MRTGALAREGGIETVGDPDTVVGVVTGGATASEAAGAAVVATTTAAVAMTAAGVTTLARAADRALPERIGRSSP